MPNPANEPEPTAAGDEVFLSPHAHPTASISAKRYALARGADARWAVARDVRLTSTVAALIEQRNAAVAALREVAREWKHDAPHDCYATGPATGEPYTDLVRCPGCPVWKQVVAALRLCGEEVQGG